MVIIYFMMRVIMPYNRDRIADYSASPLADPDPDANNRDRLYSFHVSGSTAL